MALLARDMFNSHTKSISKRNVTENQNEYDHLLCSSCYNANVIWHANAINHSAPIRYDHRNCLKFIFDNCDGLDPVMLVIQCIVYNALNCLTLLYDHDLICKENVGCCKTIWLKNEKYEYSCSDYCRMAVHRNSNRLLQFFHNIGCIWTDRVITTAINEGSILCLKYAHENNCPMPLELKTNIGSVACLNYVTNEMKYNLTSEMLDCTALYANIPCIVELLSRGTVPTEIAMENAAKSKSKLTMKILLEHGCPFNSNVAQYAAKFDFYGIDCLLFAITSGFPWDRKCVMHELIANNNYCGLVSIITLDKNTAAAIDDSHILSAIKNEISVERMQKIIEIIFKNNGSEKTKCDSGNPKILNAKVATEAIKKKNTEMFIMLKSYGCNYNETTSAAAASFVDGLPILKWLVEEHNCPIGILTYAAAIRSRNEQCTQYLIANGCQTKKKRKNHKWYGKF